MLEALAGGERRIEKIWIAFGRTGTVVAEIQSKARELRVPVSHLDRARLDAKSGAAKHQGVVALCSPVRRVSLQDFLDTPPGEGPRFFALLDGIEDPYNLGAVIRSACAAGLEGVLLPDRRICPVTPVVSKASSGAVEHVPIVDAGNSAEALRQIRDRGILVVGADPDGESTMYKVDLRRDLCLVLGGEGKGLRPGLEKLCDHRVVVPMIGPVSSLNVSVASGILFYEVVRQRRFS